MCNGQVPWGMVILLSMNGMGWFILGTVSNMYIYIYIYYNYYIYIYIHTHYTYIHYKHIMYNMSYIIQYIYIYIIPYVYNYIYMHRLQIICIYNYPLYMYM